MAKKAELLEQAKAAGLEVTEKNTIKEIEAALATAPAIEEATEAADSEEVAPTTAKAGKRSAKALREAEEEQEKESRKEAIASGEITEDVVKKGPAPKTRPRSERRSKAYMNAAKAIDATKLYEMNEAIKLALASSTVSFDATVELHVKLGVDPRQADQNIRDSVVLPHGTGKTIRVAVFGNSDDVAAAKKAGADIAGEADFLDQLKKEVIDFDVLISSPQMMAQLGKFARLLGPKGLMPNPKSGTVTTDVAKAVTDAKAGRVEYRVDSQGIIHLGVGKVSFGEAKVAENIDVVVQAVKSAKPNSIKGTYIQSINVTTSMGPAVKVQA